MAFKSINFLTFPEHESLEAQSAQNILYQNSSLNQYSLDLDYAQNQMKLSLHLFKILVKMNLIFILNFDPKMIFHPTSLTLLYQYLPQKYHLFNILSLSKSVIRHFKIFFENFEFFKICRMGFLNERFVERIQIQISAR